MGYGAGGRVRGRVVLRLWEDLLVGTGLGVGLG